MLPARALLRSLALPIASFGAGTPNEALNLAPNPSMEDSSSDVVPHGWRVETGRGQLDASTAHGGRRSLKVSASERAEAAWISDPVSLELGRTYELAGFVRAAAVEGDGPDAGATLAMKSFPISSHSPAIRGTQDWTRVRVTFTATAPSDRIRCAVGGEKAAGSAWFDEIELRPTEPDPMPPGAVRRYGPAYRYDQAGWLVLHIEGEPYERGYQHGALLSSEIEEFIGRSARTGSSENPKLEWKWVRRLSDSIFLRRYTPELLLEMKGIADGAAARGAKWDDRPVDLLDVVSLNAWTEIMCLDGALAHTPTGLEGRLFKEPFPTPDEPPRVEKCSAFAATGPATADGKIVFGHITMFGLYISRQFNVMIDVKPTQGHRVLMQGYPGAIQSGMDYYMNDAGILITETTIDQGPFDVEGTPEASRIRNAAQYSESIDDVASHLTTRNNGLYANEWLIGDVKTNEIAMLELGTRRTKLWRSSRNEWPGGTEGFYWGCNNTKDADVRSEYVPDPLGKPRSLLFKPADRDLKWLELYRRFQGKIDLTFGTLAFATTPICGRPSLDAKVTTSDMAKNLMTWAYFGRPNGKTWEPTDSEKKAHDDVLPLISSGWTVLRLDSPTLPPPDAAASAAPAVAYRRVDATRHGERGGSDDPDDHADKRAASDPPHFVPPWRGTVLPRTDADLWLAAGWARYYQIAEEERKAEAEPAADAERRKTPSKVLHDKLAASRARYLAAVGRDADTPLSALRFEYASDIWHQIAEAKGAWVLHELRRVLGDEAFFTVMNECGDRFAGKSISTGDLRKSAETASGQDLAWFFDQWIERKGLPRFRLTGITAKESGGAFQVEATIAQDDPPYRIPVEVVLASESGSERQRVWLEGNSTRVRFTSATEPRTIQVDPEGDHLAASRPPFAVSSYMDDLGRVVIVYGTQAEEAANRYAAERIRERFRTGWWLRDIPVLRDVDVTEQHRKTRHLLLVGRPETNRVAAEFESAFPIAFAGSSFEVEGKSYARSSHALIEAAANPLEPGLSLVLIAGLGPEATVIAADRHPEGVGYAVFDGKRALTSGWLEEPAARIPSAREK